MAMRKYSLVARTRFSELRSQVAQRPGVKEFLSAKQNATFREISQIEPGEWLEITQNAISKKEHADDVRVSTVRHTSKPWALDWSLLRYLMGTMHAG